MRVEESSGEERSIKVGISHLEKKGKGKGIQS